MHFVQWLFSSLLISVLLLSGRVSASMLGGEFFIFPVVQAEARLNAPSSLDDGDYDGTAGADLFYSRGGEKLDLLAEFFVDGEEQELERLQIGFPAGESIQLWIGRYHSPLSYWNTAFHHGRFFQPTADNPAIVDFEENGGPLPTHLTGILLSSEQFTGDFSYSLDLAAGLGPMLGKHGLEPFDLLRPRNGRHSISGVVRAGIGNSAEGWEIGFSAAATRIDRESGGGRVKQSVVSGYAHAVAGRLTVIAEAFVVRDRFRALGRMDTASFVGGYVQGEYRPLADLGFYLRFEDIMDNRGDAYLASLGDFVNRKELLGGKVYLSGSQALNLEYSRNRQLGDTFSRLLLQLSAVLQ